MTLSSVSDNFRDYRQVVNDSVGGDIVAIHLRQSSRLSGLLRAQIFRAQQVGGVISSRYLSYAAPEVFLAGVPVTVKSQESYTYNADMSQFPIETGANLTDHVILQPVRVSISAEVTNWEGGRAEQGLQLLDQMWRNRALLDLTTRHTVMKNMVLVNFQADTSVPNWGALSFRATFQQADLVTLRKETYPIEKVTPTAKTGGPDVRKSVEDAGDNGKQQPQPSVLSDIFNKK